MGGHSAYLVDWGEINAVVESISLELSVVMRNRLDIRAVERDGLQVAIDGLAIPGKQQRGHIPVIHCGESPLRRPDEVCYGRRPET